MNTPVFQAGEFSLPLDRTYVMGILNVTPDSFSDGGKIPGPRRRPGAGFGDEGGGGRPH